MSDETIRSPFSILAALGALVVVTGIFMEWGTGVVDIVIGHTYVHYTGWEVINDRELADAAPGIGTVPGMVLAIGAVSLVLSIVSAVGKRKVGTVSSAVCTVGCMVSFYLMFRLMNDISNMDVKVHGLPLTVDLEIGFWVCMTGVTVLLIGSAVRLIAGIRKCPAADV